MVDHMEDHPEVSLHPPTVFFSALLIGFIIRIFAGGWLAIPRVFAEGFGGLIVVIALTLVISSVKVFGEGGETLTPSTPSGQLFKDGPYKYSRNPIYLAMVLFGVGFGIATLNLWVIVMSVATGGIFHFFVILPEEEYLSRRFGQDYEAYKSQVRRWI